MITQRTPHMPNRQKDIGWRVWYGSRVLAQRVKPKFGYIKSRTGWVIHIVLVTDDGRSNALVVWKKIGGTRKYPYATAQANCGAKIMYGDFVDVDGDHPDVCKTCIEPLSSEAIRTFQVRRRG